MRCRVTLPEVRTWPEQDYAPQEEDGQADPPVGLSDTFSSLTIDYSATRDLLEQLINVFIVDPHFSYFG